MGMGIGPSNDRTPTPHVNVTPLVDVALVVLIIFMVVTPLLTKTFWLNIPTKPDPERPRPTPTADSPPVVMTVDADGTIRINRKAVTSQQIRAELPRMLAAQRRPILFFDASDRAPYGAAVDAMDLSRSAGVRSIAVLTENVTDER